MSEQIVRLPHSYLIADREQLVAAAAARRGDHGLPETGFVFACINNSYKYEPEIFAIWMRILAQVPGSVLWLKSGGPTMEANLHREAGARGVIPERILFARGRLPKPEHLARLRLADLFLDTYPYNAGTTASDALRMGLPLVTVSGQCFASRMAGSLLRRIGLPWGIAGSLAEYTDKAVEAAADPARYREIRAAVGDLPEHRPAAGRHTRRFRPCRRERGRVGSAAEQTGRGIAVDKVALITGITGQDGAYLAELLLGKGYIVHGVKRRSSSFNTGRIEHLYHDRHEEDVRFFLHYGDLTDATNLIRLVQEIRPAEIYNLAAQSHVQVSFETPEYTANADGLGTLRLLEAIRILRMEESARFYQASTSELYGKVREIPQRETTPFYPRSPYAAAKLYAYWITVNYREAYGLHASNGILFNHEGPTRGETFVTRKITRAVAAIETGRQQELYIGNLDARRDWGHARDYVEGMWRMLQQPQPDDYVLATGEAHSVREFVELAFAHVGRPLEWQGAGVDEVGRERATGTVRVRVDSRYFRPTEVDVLLGDPAKARE